MWLWNDIPDLKSNFARITSHRRLTADHDEEAEKEEKEEEEEEVLRARELARAQTPFEEPPDEKLWRQLLSLRFLAAVVFCLAASFFVSYGLGTVPVQLAHLDPDNSVFDVQLFSIIGCFGFIAVPLYGYIVDHFGVAAMSFVWMFIVSVWFGLSMVRNVTFQIVFFVWFACGRASCGTTVANYLRRTFGAKHFATLAGIAWLIGSCAASVQPPLVDFSLNDLNGNFVPVNTACIFLPLLGLGVPILSILFVRKMRRAKAMPHATPSPLPTPQPVKSTEPTPDVDLDVLRGAETPEIAHPEAHEPGSVAYRV